MKPHKVLHEAHDHFVVDDGSGTPFKVAKEALRHTTVEKIRAYARGGEVRAAAGDDWETPRSYAEGGEVPPILQDATPDYSAMGLPPPPPPRPATGIASAAEMPPDAAAQLAALRTRHDAQLADLNSPAPYDPARGVVLPGPEAAAKASMPPLPEPPPPAPGALGKAPKPPADIQRGAQQEAAGVQNVAQAESQGLAQMAQRQEETGQRYEQMRADSEQTLASRMVRQESLFNDMMNSKVDPNRLWHNMSTGQRVGAIVGLVLGGIGAGLSRGPNYAAELLDKAIDRDMEAQKIDLGKRKTLLEQYMSQTKDLTAAQHLMRADYMTAAAARLQATASSMGSQKATAQADVMVGQLKQRVATELQSATARELQIREQAALAPVQIESAKVGLQGQKLGLASAQLQADALRALTANDRSGGGNGGQLGATLDPRAISYLSPEVQSRLVSLPDGSYAMARTPQDAEKVKTSQVEVARLKADMQRYRALLDKHQGDVTPGISRTFNNAEFESAKALHSSIITAINGLANLQRLNSEEVALFSERVPDITDLSRHVGKAAKLEELGKQIDDAVWSNNTAYLNLPRRSKPGG